MEQIRAPKKVYLVRSEGGSYTLISTAVGARSRAKAVAAEAAVDAYRAADPTASYDTDAEYRKLADAEEAAWTSTYPHVVMMAMCEKQFHRITGLTLQKGESVAVTITIEEA